MYADKNGYIQDSPARQMFCIVDGIVGGEGNGPLDPTPKPAGIIVAGENPVAVDLVCAGIMGFDFAKLPLPNRSFVAHPFPLVAFDACDVIAHSNDDNFGRNILLLRDPIFDFKPHFGWEGNIERADSTKSFSNLVTK